MGGPLRWPHRLENRSRGGAIFAHHPPLHRFPSPTTPLSFQVLSDDQRIIVFVNTKRQCDAVARQLDGLEYRCTLLHGGKTQDQREESIKVCSTAGRACGEGQWDGAGVVPGPLDRLAAGLLTCPLPGC